MQTPQNFQNSPYTLYMEAKQQSNQIEWSDLVMSQKLTHLNRPIQPIAAQVYPFTLKLHRFLAWTAFWEKHSVR